MKHLILSIFCLLISNFSSSQTKVVDGLKHKIFVNKPLNWIELPDEGPFYIIPDFEEESGDTYINIIGNDFSSFQKLEEFIEDLHENIKKHHNGIKIEKFDFKFKKINKNSYTTGKYKAYTYTENDQKQCIIFIECKMTIVELVFSAKDELRYKKFLKSFENMANSIRVVGKPIK